MAAPSSWKAWRSVSVAWARMGTEVPAKLEELLAGIGAAIDAVGGSFTMRYTRGRLSNGTILGVLAVLWGSGGERAARRSCRRDTWWSTARRLW